MTQPDDERPTPPRRETEEPAPVARTTGGLNHHNSIALGILSTPIVSMKILKLTFKTDHAVMADYTANWESRGSVASKPEWTFGNPSAAVSYSKKITSVVVELVFEVNPSNADSTPCQIEGTAPFGGLRFSGSAIMKGGTTNVTVVGSTLTLSPDTVAMLSGDIAWKLTPHNNTSQVFDAGSSWGHVIYTTMDTPVSSTSWDAGITKKRMEESIKRVRNTGSNDPHTIVASLMKLITGYTLVPDSSVPTQYDHPKYFNNVGGAWAISDYVSKSAECQAIVRWVRGLIKHVGCPGTADWVTVWADPDINNGSTAQEAIAPPDRGLDKTKIVNGRTWFAALVDRNPEEGKIYDTQSFTSNYMGLNRYEACLRFEHNGVTKYYGGGAGVYTSAEQVLLAFYALCWVSWTVSSTGAQQVKVEKIVKRWRDASGNIIP